MQYNFITALHGMPARTSYGSRSVCMSVCLSNAWIVTKWKKYLSRFFCTVRKIT